MGKGQEELKMIFLVRDALTKQVELLGEASEECTKDFDYESLALLSDKLVQVCHEAKFLGFI